jgi:FMN phosphatase YigB (HAD superfamily)
MTLTLLLDLDDTLLNNQMKTFLPAYLDALGNFMADVRPTELFIQQLMRSTRKMTQNLDPARSLKQVFDEDFYPSLGLQEEEVREQIDSFYMFVFPELKKVTRRKNSAIDLVHQAKLRGYRLVVATNPLFPQKAMEHRLAWAGLELEDFELITSYETFHFAKPHPAYYAEILSRLGWPESPIVMVGNSYSDDILPANQLGLPTFWINPKDGENGSQRSASGTLKELIPWIDSQSEKQLLPDYHSIQSYLSILRSTPATLKSFTEDLDRLAWIKRPEPDEWAPNEIICHLRDLDQEVNIPRIKRILSQDNPFISGADTHPWADERQYILQDGEKVLTEFILIRNELLSILAELDEQGWERTARHAIFGPTSLSEVVRIFTGHDQLHVRQMYRTLNTIRTDQAN